MKGRFFALSALCIAAILVNIKLAIRHDSSLPANLKFSPLETQKFASQRSDAQPVSSKTVRDNTVAGLGSNNNVANRQHEITIPLIIKRSRPEIRQAKSQNISSHRTKISTNESSSYQYTVAGLDCAAYGGPADASEMIYWRDVPQDDVYTSPYYSSSEENEKYITFEPDEGGFNNIRMALETVITMAVAMGRTLVIPPSQGIYLLDEGSNMSQKNHFSFTDFYPLEAVARENKGLKLISMETFLQKQELLVNHTSGKLMIPPRTDWNGASKALIWELHQFLRWVGRTPSWIKCVVAFAPSDRQQTGLLQKLKRLQHRKARDLVHLPSNTSHRLAKTLAHRKNVCMYDTEWQSTKVIHFTGDIASGTRLLIHFYAYLFFVDPPTELLMKRFVRDHLRYVDEIQCAAVRIVEAMKEKARLHSGSKHDLFDTFHVRRGDFKVSKTLLGADEIYSNIADVMTSQSTLYIATDETNRSFFEPFFEHHHVYFLNDFEHLVTDINTNYYGLVEQLVVARGRLFVGCMFSTFSSFVMRLRGYHSTYNKLPGHRNGTLPTSYYYAPLRAKEIMHTYQELSKPIHSREFPMGWTDIDLDDHVESDLDGENY